jgi:hypothetical protein
MSDPSGYVADQIGQMANADPGAASTTDLAEAVHGSAGLGVTEADLEGIKALLASFQARLEAAEATQRAVTPDALTSSVAALNVQLANHGDPVAMELGKDATEAAASATESGDTGPLENIIARIAKQLVANPPAPGDHFHYNLVRDTAAVHVPDVIVAFAPQSSAELAREKVIAGSVVG